MLYLHALYIFPTLASLEMYSSDFERYISSCGHSWAANATPLFKLGK